MVQLQGVRLERYRDGCPVLSARAERLLIEDLTGRWLADGVQVHIQPEGR